MAVLDYKGHDVAFNEKTEEWYYGDISDKSYQEVCLKIQKQLDADAGKYGRLPVIVVGGLGSSNVFAHRGIMTSVLKGAREAWVTLESGGRGKYPITQLYPADPHNEKLFDEVEIAKAAVISLENDIRKAVAAMTKLRL